MGTNGHPGLEPLCRFYVKKIPPKLFLYNPRYSILQYSAPDPRFIKTFKAIYNGVWPVRSVRLDLLLQAAVKVL